MPLVDELVNTAIGRAAAQRQLPESTYRLQFHKGFTFHDAAAIVPYLRDLGVTHVYCSPYLTARAGSTHGYDMTDPTRINPELGGDAEFALLNEALARAGLHQILDTVPNHMGVGTNENAWWNDVLEHGRQSRYAEYFDVAWEASPRASLKNRVLLPVLGDHYGAVLERGELKVVHEGGRLLVAYYDRRFPLNASSLEAARLGARPAARQRGAELAEALSADHDLLDALLQKQHYRLAYWRTASDEINYRRFFDINDLAALQMERQEVFDAVHALTLQLAADGVVSGLRVDHPDGLYDPKQYFQRLQVAHVLNHARTIQRADKAYEGIDDAILRERIERRLRKAPCKPLYVLAEKILAADEQLPESWPIDGTSGYDVMNVINGLFVDTDNAGAMEDVYRAIVPEARPYETLVYENKLRILQMALASELHLLALMLDRIAQSRRPWRDFTLAGLTEALRQLIASFPVYRSYITSECAGAADRRWIEHACERAKARSPQTDPAAFEFIRRVLLLEAEAERAEMLRFAGKFQQLTAPTMAKGVEDTTFYLYHRLISLNEVGGEPGHFGLAPDRVHATFAERQQRWPTALTALSTHDTKRSEDVRARINVLSEIPGLWQARVQDWWRMNARHRAEVDGVPAPSPNDEYLLYQTLIGAWPMNETADDAFISRIQAYMQKALREGKQRSSWTRPNEPYESAVSRFIERILSPGEPFGKDLADFHARQIAVPGMLNALAQTVLRITAPGIPDTYQGTELWDLSLVDPDNRRPVDYPQRQILLSEVAGGCSDELMERWRDGRIKLRATTCLLRARRDHARLFSSGTYTPLEATGARARHLFAFSRKLGETQALVVVPRMTAQLLDGSGQLPAGEVWRGTALPFTPERAMLDVISGEKVEAGRAVDLSQRLARVPVCVLLTSGE